MKVADFGELSGDVALFGGAYSNLQATLSVLAEFERRKIAISNRVFTGDAVAYCAHPQEVVDSLDGQCHWLAGNCEAQLGSGAADCGCGFEGGTLCDRLSATWYAYARSRLSQAASERLAACPPIGLFAHEGRRVGVIHGGVDDNARFLWPSDSDEKFQAEIDAVQRLTGPIDIVVAGHCGIAFQRQIGAVLWINPGVIGMPPHDGRPQTRYAILSSNGVRIERLEYDHQAAANAMMSAGLSTEYADALKYGLWPSEDVLPREMRRTQS